MMKKLLIPIVLLLILACKNDQSSSDNPLKSNSQEKEVNILTKVANAYGHENWENVEEVKFSFVVNPGENERARQWIWNPQADEVTLDAEDNKITYKRSDLSDEYIDTDRAFVNDSFWLLFPFHLVWDDIEFDVQENSTSPINNIATTKLIVKYPKEGGYTPGDKYEVYLDENYHILEWTYHPKGQEEAALANTFEDLSNFDGIKVNMIHRNPTSGFQLIFRDVSFK